jgi:hypothetical protein
MQEVTTTSLAFPCTSRDALSEILCQGAQAMLTTAIEAEVADWTDSHRDLKDERGHRWVVRNGYLPERSITTGISDLLLDVRLVGDNANPATNGFCDATRTLWRSTSGELRPVVNDPAPP